MSSVSSLRRNLTPRYPFNGPSRTEIPEQFISWDVSWEDYKPPMFTTREVMKGDKPWADKDIGDETFTPKFNQMDGQINRISYSGDYKIDEKGFPLNPMGRTGLAGRGCLGKWGPNHAADCIVTQWQNHDLPSFSNGRANIAFIGIVRGDTEEIAIPGGMVEPGEDGIQAATREFFEEVMGFKTVPDLKEYPAFANPQIIEKIYVDDHRNTDNAWIETCAVHFHLWKPMGFFGHRNFQAGDDAKFARWMDYTDDLKLYASHNQLMEKALATLAAWEAKFTLNSTL